MIIWLASYPKSGNTWIRSLLCSYFFSKNKFGLLDLKRIPRFSLSDFIENKNLLKTNLNVAEQWINAQIYINKKVKKTVFFKTHNAALSVNKNLFTDSNNSAGCIYVVRDPRNIITSYKNFESISYEKALKHMTNSDAFLFDKKKFENKFGFRGYEPIMSWSENYKSWAHNKLGIPVHLIKYEDMIKDTLRELKKIIDFIAEIQKDKNLKFDNEKGKRAVNQSSFQSLSELESINGFSEAREGRKFFHLGEQNDYRKILPSNIKKNIEENFLKEMLELEYIG